MEKPKQTKPKSKGGRPTKKAVMIEGDEAARRFKAAMGFALAGGPHQPSPKNQ